MMPGPVLKRMRKPRFCDSCRKVAWPAFGIGCPCFYSERSPALRDVHLWHCGANACEADCRARYAARLRELGRNDLAGKLTGPRPARVAPRARLRGDLAPPAIPQNQKSLF